MFKITPLLHRLDNPGSAIQCPSCHATLKLVTKTITHERRRGRRAGRAPSEQQVWVHAA